MRFAPIAVAVILLAPPALAHCPRVGVDIKAKADRLTLTYRFPTPVEAIDYAMPDGNLRVENWIPKTPEASWSGSTLKLLKPTTSIVFDVAQDKRGVDRQYAAASRVEDGNWVLFEPYLAVKGARTVVRYQALDRITSDVLAEPACRKQGDYLADPDSFETNAFIEIRGTPLPAGAAIPWLHTAVRNETKAALAYYTTTFGPIKRQPVIRTSFLYDPKQHSFQGEVVERGPILLVFRGLEWLTESDQARDTISHTVWHELFHFWTEPSQVKGDAFELISEGSADYISKVARYQTGRLKGETLDGMIASVTTNCIDELSKPEITNLRQVIGNLRRYDCGMLQHWIADQTPWAGTDSGKAVFPLWRTLLAGKENGLRMFNDLAARNQATKRLLDALDSGIRTKDWAPLVIELNNGTTTSATLTDLSSNGDAMLVYALLDLAKQVCAPGDAYGVGVGMKDPQVAAFYTGPSCGEISNNTKFKYVDDIEATKDQLATARYVVAACKRLGTLHFRMAPTDEPRSVACKRPIPSIPPEVTIERQTPSLSWPKPTP